MTSTLTQILEENILLRRDHLRYEALRKLTPRQFMQLWDRNLKGERFDDLVDELVTQNMPKSTADMLADQYKGLV